MNYDEHPLRFACGGDSLYGVLSMPEQALPRAVLIVVGGPQYRAGSHRQFVLLAREFAAQGYPVLRFDYRGMGDSDGATRNFEHVDDDLRAAVDQLFAAAPSTREVVLLGLCDGASAALFYARRDARVGGLVLVNPWARTEEGEAKTRLKHYYQARLLDSGLWKKIARRDFDYGAAARSLWHSIGRAYGGPPATGSGPGLPHRLYHGFRQFKGRVLLVLSENDLTAQEFRGLVQTSAEWRSLMHTPRVQWIELRGANHTFSRRAWREQLAGQMREWLGRQ